MTTCEQSQQPPQKPPWNPRLVGALTFVLTGLVTGVWLGLNWRRLHKPNWTAPTITLALGVTVAGLGLLISLVRLVFLQTLADDTMRSAALLVIGLSIFVPSAFFGGLARLQGGAYRAWRRHGYNRRVFDLYEYPFGRVVLSYAVLAIVGTAVFFVPLNILLAPQPYEHPAFTVTLPSRWRVVDTDDVPGCEVSFFEDGYECVVVTGRTRLSADTTSFRVFRYRLVEGLNFDEFVERVGETISQQPGLVEDVTTRQTPIDGHDAIELRFALQPPGAEKPIKNVSYYYAANETTAYEFAFNSTVYERDRDEIEQLLGSLQIRDSN